MFDYSLKIIQQICFIYICRCVGAECAKYITFWQFARICFENVLTFGQMTRTGRWPSPGILKAAHTHANTHTNKSK